MATKMYPIRTMLAMMAARAPAYVELPGRYMAGQFLMSVGHKARSSLHGIQGPKRHHLGGGSLRSIGRKGEVLAPTSEEGVHREKV